MPCAPTAVSDGLLRAVHVQQAGLVGNFQRITAGRRIARPEQDFYRLVRGRQAALDVIGGADDFSLEVEFVARDVEMVSLLLRAGENAVLGLRVPKERVGVGMAGNFHMR